MVNVPSIARQPPTIPKPMVQDFAMLVGYYIPSEYKVFFSVVYTNMKFGVVSLFGGVDMVYYMYPGITGPYLYWISVEGDHDITMHVQHRDGTTDDYPLAVEDGFGVVYLRAGDTVTFEGEHDSDGYRVKVMLLNIMAPSARYVL